MPLNDDQQPDGTCGGLAGPDDPGCFPCPKGEQLDLSELGETGIPGAWLRGLTTPAETQLIFPGWDKYWGVDP